MPSLLEGAEHAQPTSRKPLTLLVGLSGPSSSGKTTLARLLRTLFSLPAAESGYVSLSLFILHQDDFYHTDALIPLITTPSNAASGLGARELQDWDCVESLDLDLTSRTLQFVKNEGRLPVRSTNESEGDGEDWGESKEDQNSVGPVDLPEGLLDDLRKDLEHWWAGLSIFSPAPQPPTRTKEPTDFRLCILDGFLLYPDPASPNPDLQRLQNGVTGHLTLKLMLLASRDQTITRRTRRTGYVTLEGFWEDPPGYVEDVVWPNYVKDAAWLMRGDGDCSAESKASAESKEPSMVDVDERVAERAGIKVAPGKGQVGLGALLKWTVGELRGAVEATLTVGGKA
ncbi:Nicotinamide riboside kinase [Cyphellophora attinorum]|uniref:Nicotinamide riboside kinase n=1 Tax=Cyphellophora attinorum TaxID=1664694 RepID=A0A0N1H5H1_9EURO|nr:Nicotinamide riboside kinase [Phialophora attinorum]KPI40977.1 Nicotinamide riboside kinase [Phialophora attinorum]